MRTTMGMWVGIGAAIGAGVGVALGAVAIVLLAACSSVRPDDDRLRVLFIGNSLTSANDLPAMVAALGQADGRPISYKTVAYPDAALLDHWIIRSTREDLAESDWDVVVLQQGPSSLPENQENLRSWAKTWADAAREQGAVPALYMVWPADSRRGDFQAVVESYTNAAAAAEAQLYPAGSAWLRAWEEEPALSLYGPDGFHPSETGSYLAALVVYGGLTGASLSGLPSELDLAGGTVSIQEARARILRTAATEALAEIEATAEETK